LGLGEEDEEANFGVFGCRGSGQRFRVWSSGFVRGAFLVLRPDPLLRKLLQLLLHLVQGLWCMVHDL